MRAMIRQYINMYRMPICKSFAFWWNFDLSLPVSESKQISPLQPWVVSEVKPDTGRHGVTGLGHLDFSAEEQMLVATV